MIKNILYVISVYFAATMLHIFCRYYYYKICHANILLYYMLKDSALCQLLNEYSLLYESHVLNHIRIR